MKNKTRTRLLTAFILFHVVSGILIAFGYVGVNRAAQNAFDNISASMPIMTKAFDSLDNQSEAYDPSAVKVYAEQLSAMSKEQNNGLTSAFAVMAYSLTNDHESLKSAFKNAYENLSDAELPMFLYVTKSYWNPDAYQKEIEAIRKLEVNKEPHLALINLSDPYLAKVKQCVKDLPQLGSYEIILMTILEGLDIKFHSCKTS